MPATIAAERPDAPDVVALIAELDTHLEPLYPPESRHGFSVQRLVAERVEFFVLRDEGRAAGCGGILLVGDEYAEVKRMYVRPEFRGRGFARLILHHLEDRARAHRLPLLRLQTGIHQHDAIRLYERSGFYLVPPFGPYSDDPVSRCYEKRLT